MVFFEHHSWRAIEKLEIYFGLWPYQIWFKNIPIRVIFVLLMASGFIPIAVRFKKEWGVNLGIAAENISGMLLIGGILVKMIVACIFNQKRQKIYDKLYDHFRTIVDTHEAFVLNKSAEHGMIFCVKYLILHGAVFAIFFCLPVAKMLLEYSMKIGELEKIFPYYVDYSFVDEDKYYGLILCQILSVCISFAGMNCACDFAFIMNVRHVCALFKIVKIRLEKASGFLEEFEWNMLDFTTADNKAHDFISQAIDSHNEALEMVSLLDEAYNFCWLLVLLANTLIFSVSVYLMLLNLVHPFDLLRHFTFFVALYIHFYVQFLHGQMIIDSSGSVFDACYNVKWYIASKKTSTLLSIMMSRSFTPCVITGGRFFIISMETYGKLIKAGFSYLSIFTQRMSN